MKEIERRFLVEALPECLEQYKMSHITQGYIFFDPVVRLRRKENDYFLTVKTKGLLVRDEFEIPVEKENFDKMWKKVEGNIIDKLRYEIPLETGNLAELDIFGGQFSPLAIVEVEFDSLDAAQSFIPPYWFGKEITLFAKFSNKFLAEHGLQNDEAVN